MAENIGKRLEKKEPKQTKKPGHLTKQQKWLLAAAIVLAAVLLAVVAWKSVFVKPELPGGTKPDGTQTENGIDYGDGAFDLPDVITVYKGPHERCCDSAEELAEEVRKTVVHEVGHYFGLTDDELYAMGY